MSELYKLPLFNDVNLLSYWRMEGNSNDSKGSSHGTDTNITYSAANGKHGLGAGFDGTTSQIAISSVAGAAVYTIAAWVYFKTLIANRTLFVKRNAANNANYALQIGASSNIELVSYNGITAVSAASAISPLAATKCHIAGIINGASSKIFLNGLEISVTGSLQTHNAGTDIFIGANSGASFSDVNMDDVGIFSRALTAAEIMTLYKDIRGGHFLNHFV